MRLETGPVQMPDDWPGVFIRGDNALAFAMSLRVYLEMTAPATKDDHALRLKRASLQGLMDTLNSCRADECKDPQLIAFPERTTP